MNFEETKSVNFKDLALQIINDLESSTDPDDFKVKFNVHEVDAISRVISEVFEVLDNERSSNFSLSPKVNLFINSLGSAYQKLNSL